MKRISIAAILIGMVISFFALNPVMGGADTSLADIKAKGFFVVGLDDAFPPMGFRDKRSNDIVGFDIDLAKKCAEKIGVKVKFQPVAWDGIILSLNKKDIDVIWNGLTITDERKKQIGFTKAYLANRQVIVIKKDSAINNKAALKGKTVGLQLGSSSETALNSDKKTAASLKEVKKYQDNQLALLDLASGRIDAVVIDEIVVRYAMSQKPGLYTIIKDDFGNEQYGVGYRKGDTSFGKALDKALDEIKKDGSADAISKKWFGEAIIKK